MGVWDVSRNDLWMTERGRSLYGLDPASDVLPVKGDSVQLQQVMSNLMLNAFSA